MTGKAPDATSAVSTLHTDERVRTSRVCGIVCVRAGDVLQPCTTRGSDKCLETVRASVLFDAIVGRPSARLATCVRARRPSGAVHHFNWIAESSRRSQTHQTKPQQLGRQALDADAVEAEQLSLVVSEGCSVSIERHGCHSHSCVRDSTHTRPILHTSCSC